MDKSCDRDSSLRDTNVAMHTNLVLVALYSRALLILLAELQAEILTKILMSSLH